jgi:hypothetical protein
VPPRPAGEAVGAPPRLRGAPSLRARGRLFAMDGPQRSGPARRGLVEYVVLVAVLALLAAGALALFGDRIRALFGVPGPATAAERSRG